MIINYSEKSARAGAVGPTRDKKVIPTAQPLEYRQSRDICNQNDGAVIAEGRPIQKEAAYQCKYCSQAVLLSCNTNSTVVELC